MKRFEAPGRFWEVESEDERSVCIVFGKAGTSGNRIERHFASAAERVAYVEAQIKRQIAQGYVPATAKPIDEHERRVRFEWSDSSGTVGFEIVEQLTLRVAWRRGQIFDGKDQTQSAFVSHFKKREDADRRFEDECEDIRYATGAEPVAEPEHVWHSEPALEAQCDEARDAPGPWTVYADWLMSHGDLRGELAALANAQRDDDVAAMVEKHRRWLLGNDFARVEVEWRNGFVVGVTFRKSSGEALELVVRAVLASPLGRFVEQVRFAADSYTNDWSLPLLAIAESRRARFIRSVRFDAFDRVDGLRYDDLAKAWPKLTALDALHIHANADASVDELVRRLVHSPFVRQLRALAFVACKLGTADVDTILGAADSLAHLALDLAGNYFTAEDVARLVERLPNVNAANQSVRPEPIPEDDEADEDDDYFDEVRE
jgi:predicted DNA-binding WGR domain protein